MNGAICGDNRFEVIEKAKQAILDETNIKDDKAQMAELDSFLFRCWQMGWLKKYDDIGSMSDGYHTFDELYEYRLLYNASLFNEFAKQGLYDVHKSKKHSDGEECFGGGWFIVMAELPTGQVSNHYELKDWDLFQVPEKEKANVWDGHTPQDVAKRMREFLTSKTENGFPHRKEQLDFKDLTQEKANVKEKSLPKDKPNYWDKLKHQYAGMAMQGILSNNELYREICKSRNLEITIMEYATDLVNKLKEES